MLAQLSLGDFAALAGVIIGGCGVVTTLLAVYLRSLSNGFKSTITDLRNWLQHVDDRVAQVERDTPLAYVSKDEWLRAQHRTQRLQDTAIDKLARLEEKLDAQTGLAASMSANTRATVQLAESMSAVAKHLADNGSES